MQPPDGGNWDDQNHQIAHNIDDAGAHHYRVLVDALIFPYNAIGFADALGYYCQNKSNRIEKVPVEDEPDARCEIKISFSFSLRCEDDTTIAVDLCVTEGACSREHSSFLRQRFSTDSAQEVSKSRTYLHQIWERSVPGGRNRR